MSYQRRHKRIPIAASAILRHKNREDSPPLDAMVANISISGIGLYTDKNIEKHSVVSLEIKFISCDGNLYSASISGRTIYVNVIDEMTYTGIEFDEMINPAGQPHLYKHLYTAMKSSFNEE